MDPIQAQMFQDRMARLSAVTGDRPEFYDTMDFQQTFGEVTPTFIASVRKSLSQRGMVIIDNISLDETAIKALTEAIGETVVLAPFLVPAKLPAHPEITRVGNYDEATGQINKSYSFGFAWHHDGDFWEPGRNRIVNLLYSRIVAPEGGRTGFIKSRTAYDRLDEDTRRRLANIKVQCDFRNFEEFRNVSPEMRKWFPQGEDVQHSMVFQGDGYKSLYLPYYEGSYPDADGNPVTHADVIALLEKEENIYTHQWSENQLCIWDNTQWMHCAMGSIQGKRLLWRTQARIPISDGDVSHESA